MRTTGHFMAWTCALVLAAMSCDDDTPVCIPATVAKDCLCATGQRGSRTCESDGLDYGRCVCGDGGISMSDGGSALDAGPLSSDTGDGD